MKKLILVLLAFLGGCLVVDKYQPKEKKSNSYEKAKEKSGQFRQD